MGCADSTDEKPVAKPASEEEEKQPFKLDKICDLPFYPQTPPIINNDEAIFFYSSKRGLRYLTLNLNKRTITKKKTETKM